MRSATIVLTVLIAFAGAAGPARGQSPGWRRPDLKPVSQPSVVGDRVVLFVAAGGGLRVMALDAATGATVWSHAATTSDMAPGETPELGIIGGQVLYLAKESDSVAAAAAADIETGTVRWSARGSFGGMPAPCPDAPSAVCVTGLLGILGALEGINRFDPATGELLSITVLGDGARDVGDGLIDPGGRHPERLIAAGGMGVRWSRPLRRIFRAGHSTDWGWEFNRYDDLGLFIGSAGAAPRRNGSRLIVDLAKESTAAFSTGNGRVRWRRPGWFECGTLPCPADDGLAPASTIGLRVVERGTLTYPADPDAEAVVSRDAAATLQGFDLASGRTRWSFDAGRNVPLIFDTLPPQTGPRTISVRNAHGRLRELDLESGRSHPAAAGTVGWCRHWLEYHENVGYEIDGHVITDYTGDQSVFPCSPATGRRVAVPAQVPAFVGLIGARSGDLVVWSDASAVTASPVAP